MKIQISVSRDTEVQLRKTKWFILSYVREEFKPGKSNHLLHVHYRQGKFDDFSILIESGGDDEVGKDLVEAFVKPLPDSVDAPFLRSLAKRTGRSIV